MTNQKIVTGLTVGVTTVGRMDSLHMMLSSVLLGTHVPERIIIRLEGELPSFGTFYMEQLSELARFKGVDFMMQVTKSQGVREARDWLLDSCMTDYLFMVDDDVVLEFDCVGTMFNAIVDNMEPIKKPSKVAYMCGSKGDVNNRRGYKNFKVDVKGAEGVYDNCPFNWFYDKKACAGKYAQIYTCDTGITVFNVNLVKEHNIRFAMFDHSMNSGGEDTLFALECRHQGLEALIVPSARSYHLEKEVVTFADDFAPRAEMILRVIELRGYKGKHVEYMKKVFMPWLFDAKGDGT